MSRRARRSASIAVGLALLLLAAAAAARPGGGSSFGGGHGSSGHSGGSGGSGGGEALFLLLRFLIVLTIEHPAIGVPLDVIVVVIGIVVAVKRMKPKPAGWSTTAAQQALSAPRRALRRELLQAVSARDPDFSLVLFEDFLYALFAAAHEARGRQRVDSLAPWLSAPVRGALRQGGAGLSDVRAVVVGAMRLTGFSAARADRVTVELEFEANYSEVAAVAPAHSGAYAPPREQSYYVRERWSLSRKQGARSRPPQKARSFECPNCGAPLAALRGNVCTHCQHVVDTGELDWLVDGIRVLERTAKAPQLTSDTEERGTALATVVDPRVHAAMARLTQRDPSFSWPALQARIGVVFGTLQVAWSSCELPRARPFVSDQLFQMFSYWIEAYQREGLRNRNDRARITRIELAALVSDRHFDAITLRLFATGLDYVVTADGSRVVSGSRSKERAYSEYWTLIRSSRARGPARSDLACPRCGAPLAVNMAGSCTYCAAHVVSGDFDWVLSRIEQDEAYSG